MNPKSEQVPFSIQKKILEYLSKSSYNISSLARKINVHPITLHQQLQRPTIQVNRLWSICKALEWNLFQEISLELEQEINRSKDETKESSTTDIQEENESLKKKVELLENENKTLKEVISLLKA